MFPFSSIRVIPFEYFNGTVNMALDLFYAELVEKNQTPILRFYGWKPYCLSLGRHQDLKNVDIAALSKDGIDIVRRPTGGSAILHAEELTYSFIVPKLMLNHHEIYETFHVLLARVLQKMGFDVTISRATTDNQYLNKGNNTFACFNRAAKSEIQYNGKKVVGSAQKLYKEAILQHGSIILGNEHEKIISYINTDAPDKVEQQNLLKNNSTNLEKTATKKTQKIELASNLTEEFNFENSVAIYYKYPTNSEKKVARKYNKQVVVSNLSSG